VAAAEKSIGHEPSPDQPKDTLQIRCPRLGHQIHFSYCRTENLGLPWSSDHPLLAALFLRGGRYLRRELTKDEWRDTFDKPAQPKVLTLVELIEQAQEGSA